MTTPIESYKKVNFANFSQTLNTKLRSIDQIPSTTRENILIEKCALAESISLHSIKSVLANRDVSDLCSFYNICVTDLADKIHEEMSAGMYTMYDLYDIAGRISYCSIPEEGRIITGKKAKGEVVFPMQPLRT